MLVGVAHDFLILICFKCVLTGPHLWISTHYKTHYVHKCVYISVCIMKYVHTHNMPADCISNESLKTSSPPWLRILMVNPCLGQLSWPYAHAPLLLSTPNTTLQYNAISQSSLFPMTCTHAEMWAYTRSGVVQVRIMRTSWRACCHSWQTRPPTPKVTCNLYPMCILTSI